MYESKIEQSKFNNFGWFRIWSILFNTNCCITTLSCWSWPGAYLGGGHCAMPPPLGRQDCKIAEKSKQNWGMAPPLQVGHKVWSYKGHVLCVSSRIWAKNRTKFEWRLFFCSSPDFGLKIGLNVSEDLFFLLFTWFWAKFEWEPFFFPSPDFGRKIGLNLEQFLIQIFVLTTFSEIFGPPFSKSCLRYWLNRPGIETMSTVSVTNALSPTLLISYLVSSFAISIESDIPQFFVQLDQREFRSNFQSVHSKFLRLLTRTAQTLFFRPLAACVKEFCVPWAVSRWTSRDILQETKPIEFCFD